MDLNPSCTALTARCQSTRKSVHLQIMSWNINGIQLRKSKLLGIIEENNPVVILPQETNFKPGTSIAVFNYNMKGKDKINKRERGVIVLAKRGIAHHLIATIDDGPELETIGIEIVCKNDKKPHIYSTY